MATNYKVAPFNSVINFEKFDFVTESSSNFRYFYATQNSLGQNPTGIFNYAITSFSRVNDLVTINYTYTGSAATFVQGSIIRITGMANSTLNYTGMVVNAGNGWIQYINQGWPESSSVSVGAINCNNPAWTTGFFFAPSYSTNLESKQSVMTAQFGDGYSQRQKMNLNNNVQTWKIAFNERSDKEAKAIFNYIEDYGGSSSIKLLIPVNKLQNNPNLKYVVKDPQLTTTYFDLNNISVTATQVFDL